MVWGLEDRLLPVEQARQAAPRLPNESLALLLACGHLPQVEDPGQFLAAVRPFLAASSG